MATKASSSDISRTQAPVKIWTPSRLCAAGGACWRSAPLALGKPNSLSPVSQGAGGRATCDASMVSSVVILVVVSALRGIGAHGAGATLCKNLPKFAAENPHKPGSRASTPKLYRIITPSTIGLGTGTVHKLARDIRGTASV